MKKEKNIENQSKSKNTESISSEAVAEKKTDSKPKAPKITKVGAMLKEVRLNQGLKTADVAKKLCIRKIYLDAIEDSNYKEIPPLPYGIGFIRSYANYLGLNGENIVELYKEETNISEPNDIHVLEPQPEASMPGMQYIVISLLAIVLIYLGWSSLSSNNEAETDIDVSQTDVQEVEADVPVDAGVIVVEDFNFEPPAEEAAVADEQPMNEEKVEEQIRVSEQSYAEPVADNTPVVDTEKSSPENTQKTLPEQENATVSNIPDNGVFIEVLKETWVEVKDDSKLYLSKVLQKGDTYTVPEGKGMILSLGNYDGANVYINGVLTKVARPNKKTNIALDPLLEANR